MQGRIHCWATGWTALPQTVNHFDQTIASIIDSLVPSINLNRLIKSHSQWSFDQVSVLEAKGESSIVAGECVIEGKIDQNPSRRPCISAIIYINQTFYQAPSMIDSSIKRVPRRSITLDSIILINLYILGQKIIFSSKIKIIKIK